MPENTKQLKTKIVAVQNLKKITKAMEMVARSKMKRAVESATATRAYARLALELLGNLSLEKQPREPFLNPGKNNDRTLLIYLASNKGLCGGYNATLRKRLTAYLHKHDTSKTDTIAVGKYAQKHLSKTHATVIEQFTGLPDRPTSADVEAISQKVLALFQTGNYAKVELIYTNFISMFAREVRVQPLLPISADNIVSMIETIGDETSDPEEVTNTKLPNQNLYLYEPNQEEVLSAIIPPLVKVQILQALLEALASEHSARMVAMKSATDNGEKLGGELSLRYNRARQAAITIEILEIAAGAEATR